MVIGIKNEVIANDINTKTVFVFDWDGTIFDSMSAKLKSFSAVVSKYFTELGNPVDSDFVAAIYREHSGKPRSEIFLEAAKAAVMQLGQLEIDEMSKRLFLLNQTVLAEANIFPDAHRLLSVLADRDVGLFISSSVPQAELDYFVSVALPENLRSRFSGVFGSREGCSKGREHIAHISACSGILSDKILVIGDDEADFILSKAADVACILVDRDSRWFDRYSPNVVKNLDELCNLLNPTVSTRS